MGKERGGRPFRRRWPFLVGTVVFVVAAVTAWGWLVWLPGYRPNLQGGERYGIDVSNHQGRIEWERVAADDISFAYIKATEGGDFADSRFTENWAGARAAGLTTGAYHFFTLCVAGDRQAQNFLHVVPGSPDALPAALDLELAGNCGARPDRAAVDRELHAFLELVERATGHDVVLYVGDDFETRYPVRASMGRPLWVRRLLRRPGGTGWVIWQASSFAKVDGVRGRVDLDVSR